MRAAAAAELSERDEPRAVEALLHALADPEWNVQLAAAKALRPADRPELLDALIRGLESDDTQRRTGSVLALVRCPDPRALEALVTQCRARDFAFRCLVAEAVVKSGNLHFREGLLAALKDKDWQVGEMAVLALANMHEAVGIDPVLESLKSDHPYIRKLACWQLGLIGDPRAIDALLTDMLEKYDTYTLRIWGSTGIWMIAKQLDEELQSQAAKARSTNFAAKELEAFRQWWVANKHRYVGRK